MTLYSLKTSLLIVLIWNCYTETHFQTMIPRDKNISNFMNRDNAAAAKSLQSCPTLCDPIDSSPPGSSVHGILQARTLEWVTISFSSAWKWKVKVKSLSRVRLLATPWTAAHQAPPSMGFSGQESWSGVPLPSPRRLLKISNKRQGMLSQGGRSKGGEEWLVYFKSCTSKVCWCSEKKFKSMTPRFGG